MATEVNAAPAVEREAALQVLDEAAFRAGGIWLAAPSVSFEDGGIGIYQVRMAPVGRGAGAIDAPVYVSRRGLSRLRPSCPTPGQIAYTNEEGVLPCPGPGSPLALRGALGKSRDWVAPQGNLA